MNKYLEPQEDGLLTSEMGEWSKEKLDYLERYLDMFTTSMRNKPWRALNYIDLFSGPGKSKDTSGNIHLGSPLLALTAKRPFDHYYFVDKNPQLIAALEERGRQSRYAIRTRYFAEDASVAVHQISEEIECADHEYQKGVWPCLNLAFLDPFGIEALPWKIVETLASLRTDLIIHYSQMSLQRTMPNAINDPGETVVDLFFGSREWREIYRSGKPGLYGELLGLYKERLCNLGYVDVRSEDKVSRVPMMKNSKNGPLYGLIFASKDELGEKFWQEVTKRDVHGQQRLF